MPLSISEKSHLFKLEKYVSALAFEPKNPEPDAVFALYNQWWAINWEL